MNQSIFQNLKQYFGHVFLEYILNKTFEKDLQYDQLGLNINQSQALLELHNLVTFCRTHFISVGGFGDGARFYLGDYADLYNDLRASCGGLNEEILTDDPLIAYLQKTAIKFYPTLLIKNQAEPDFPILDLGLKDYTEKDYTEFCNLIKSDNINKLTNDGIDLDYSFNFRFSSDVQIMNQVSQGLRGIVLRSFKNISLRMKYSLKDLMVEIENNVITLRKLADGQEISFSSFIGIRGLYFDGFQEINHKDFSLRPFDSISHPSQHTKTTIMAHNEKNAQYITGSILEVFHKAKLMPKDENYTMTIIGSKINTEQLEVFDRFKFALVFALDSDKGIQPSFFENGFPLGDYGYGLNNKQNNYFHQKVTSMQIEPILEWYDLLASTDLEMIKLPLKRLSYAIFERTSAEDSILDAFIAWEGIFSGAPETSMKVAGSITKYLYEPKERKEKFDYIKNLYDFRSEIVHGRAGGKDKNRDFNSKRTEVIQIGLKCLKKLLKDKNLLSLKPSKRVETLLICS